MKIRKPKSEELLFAAIAVVLVLALPLLGFLAFASRAVLIAGAVAAVAVGLVLYALSPAFRSWFEAQTEPQLSFSGLRLATDVALHPAHGWARFDDDQVVVGADDLIQATLGPIETVELPPVGERAVEGEPLFRLRRGERSVAVRSPVSGTVRSTNAELQGNPRRINLAPFAEGWAVRLQTEAGSRQRRSLLSGNPARSWFRREIDRLLATLLTAESPVPSLPDGGILIGELYRHIDDDAWKRLTETFFGAEVPGIPNRP